MMVPLHARPHRPRWRVLSLAGVLLCLCAIAHPPEATAAQRRALLVGVSEVPGQPVGSWLRAPRNDVQLMRQALLSRGWRPEAIRTLADGVPGAATPDLGAIRSALEQALDASEPGDFMLLYFSGHGTRLLDPDKRYQEPDALAEMFLARQGALHDVEIGHWIQRLLARGVFVWTVFDTCSATSMTRGAPKPPAPPPDGDDPVLFRGLGAGQLATEVRAAALASSAPAHAATDGAPFAPPARYVALFAAESHQVAPELRLPRGQPGAPMHGLLTWAITEALSYHPTTWRALFNHVLSLYRPVIDELQQRFPARELPSPVIEGALDAPLFENTAIVASTQPAWMVHRRGSQWLVAAGLLDGVVPAQPLRIRATRPGGGEPEETMVVATAPSLDGTPVTLPAAWAGLPEEAAFQATPLNTPAALALRVHARTGQARQASRGMNLAYPASIEWTGGRQAQLRIAGDADHGFTATPDGGAPERTLPDTAALKRYLAGQANWRWMSHLAKIAQSGHAAALDGFDATLWGRPGPDGIAERWPMAALSRPSMPTAAAIEIGNASGRSVDLLVAGLTAEGDLVPIFPAAAGETNRFERGSADAPARKRFPLPAALAARGGALFVLATPARPRSPPRWYGLSPAESEAPIGATLRSSAPGAAEAVYAAMAHW